MRDCRNSLRSIITTQIGQARPLPCGQPGSFKPSFIRMEEGTVSIDQGLERVGSDHHRAWQGGVRLGQYDDGRREKLDFRDQARDRSGIILERRKFG